MTYATYRVTSDAAASSIAQDGTTGEAQSIVPAGTLVQVNTAQDIVTALQKDDVVAAKTSDGRTWMVRAADVAPVEEVSSTKLYAFVIGAVVLVGIMFWNTNRK